jgi:hypothetical protein
MWPLLLWGPNTLWAILSFMAMLSTHKTSAYEVTPPLTLRLSVSALLTWDFIPLLGLLLFTTSLSRLTFLLVSLALMGNLWRN